MKLPEIKETIKSFGIYNFLIHIFVRLCNRVTYSNVMIGMILTENSLDPKYLEADQKYACRFLSNEEVYQYSQSPENDLPKEFVDQAVANSDFCYALLDGDKLASYGWYTNVPALFETDLRLHFNRDWIYMYRGYTLPAYRGQRLHAVGMARAMKSFVERGFKGLVSYVEASNFSSLKSVYRMGYLKIGKIVVIKLFGHYISWTTGSSSQYGLYLKEIAVEKDVGTVATAAL